MTRATTDDVATSRPPGTSEVAGIASIAVAQHGGRGRVTRAYATSPLKILTPQNHGQAAWVYLSSYGGGLVDGDALRVSIEVEPGAMAWLSTQASTKVYRSPRGTSQELTAHVGSGACLVAAPDPVVCFAGATYRQRQRFDLVADATLVLVDWMTSGRHGSGERWAFDEYSSRTSIVRDGRVLVHESMTLRAADGDLARRMGRFEVLAMVVLAGPRMAVIGPAIAAEVAAMPLEPQSDLVVAASMGRDETCVMRLAGRSVEQVGRAMGGYLSFLPELLGDNPGTAGGWGQTGVKPGSDQGQTGVRPRNVG